jgi:tetratricopeptide (TPR) repeat protein
MIGPSDHRDDEVDVTGTLRKAQRQIEGQHAKTGLRLLRALEPEELKLPERLRFYYLRALAQLQRHEATRVLSDLDRAAALAQQLHNGELGARIANLIGWTHQQQNRPAMALEFHERAWQAVELGLVADRAFAAIVQGNRGQAYLALGNYARAESAFQEALRQGDHLLAPVALAVIGWGLARAALEAGQPQQARVYILQAIGDYETSNHLLVLAPVRLDYAAILLKLGNNDEAERQLQYAVLESEGDSRLQVAARIALADIALARADRAEAGREAQAALTSARPLKDPTLLGFILYRIALAADESDVEGTQEAFRQATSTLRGTDQHSLLAQTLLSYARILARQGDLASAATAFEDAYRRLDPSTPADHMRFKFPLPALEGFTRTPATNLERRQARPGPEGNGTDSSHLLRHARFAPVPDEVGAPAFFTAAQE